MVIAQLTDLHVLPEGQTLDGIDTNAMLARAVAHLNALEPAPDIVLLTGDLVESARPASYHALTRRLHALHHPYYVIPGNHDRRVPLAAALEGSARLAAGGFVQHTVEDLPVRLVAVDTLDEGHCGGRLCRTRLAWLDRTLAEQPDRPTLLYMHHPPFLSGIHWMDAGGFHGLAAFEALLERHRQVVRIVCGHIHRPIITTVGRCAVSVAPSTCYQVHLDLAPGATPHIISEPPACQLHLWDGRRFITHTSYIDPPCTAVDLSRNVASPRDKLLNSRPATAG